MKEREINELARDIAKTYILKSNMSCIKNPEELIKTYIMIYKTALKIIYEDPTFKVSNNYEFDENFVDEIMSSSYKSNIDVYESINTKNKGKKSYKTRGKRF